jgi:hypothetical protein
MKIIIIIIVIIILVVGREIFNENFMWVFFNNKKRLLIGCWGNFLMEFFFKSIFLQRIRYSKTVWRERGGKAKLIFIFIFNFKKKKQGRRRGTKLKYVLTTYMLIYLVNNYFSGLGRGVEGVGEDIGKSQTNSTSEAPKSIYPLIIHYY